MTRLIKKSNDFGAGGVSVAIGELAGGLDIYLDRVPAKYAGLNATELAISESQERMAVVVEAADKERFMALCGADNIEVTHVADVTDTGRMRMFDAGVKVCDLSREFIDSAGAKHILPVEDKDPFVRTPEGKTLAEKMLSVMASPNVASQKGLVEMFDSTVGRSTVLMPYGGERQLTETQVSVQKLPVDGYTDTASVMAFGYDPDLAVWSPYHSAAYAVVEACTKVACAGADWSRMRFSYQEYFERMTHDPHTWGKPLSALLGTVKMQKELGLASIGGKDSMSGTFEHIHVPPTLVAFGITTVDARTVISPEFKKAGNRIYLLRHTPLGNRMPDTDQLKAHWTFLRESVESGKVVSAWSLTYGGVAEALVKMAMGNRLGVKVSVPEYDLFSLGYGSMVVETVGELVHPDALLLGEVTDGAFEVNGEAMELASLEKAWESRYFKLYPPRVKPQFDEPVPAVEPVPYDPANLVYPGEAERQVHRRRDRQRKSECGHRRPPGPRRPDPRNLQRFPGPGEERSPPVREARLRHAGFPDPVPQRHQPSRLARCDDGGGNGEFALACRPFRRRPSQHRLQPRRRQIRGGTCPGARTLRPRSGCVPLCGQSQRIPL